MILLGVIPTALLLGCTAKHSTSPTPPVPTQAAKTYLTGQLLRNNWVGPPHPPGEAHYSGFPGTIDITGAGSGTMHETTSITGRFKVAVQPGEYTVTAHITSEIPFMCTTSPATKVSPGSVRSVTVRCGANIG